MCDTMVALGDDGVLFAKNSDRDPNEAQLLEWHPASDHPPAATVSGTYVEAAQVAHTHAVLISRPWWMFGAEMGANEHGVVIGNEAVFTTEPDEERALLGMDLLRLGLERARTAREAVEVMVSLLEAHGQGGPCSVERPSFTYHNSFLVADPSGAIVLETAGRRWATEDVVGPSRSISNGLTIPGFAERYSRAVRARVVACARRRELTEASVARASGPLAMFAALREHGGPAPHYSPLHGSLGAPCVHAGGLVASSQTTASFVADLRAGGRLWATGTAAPCTSVFKPVDLAHPVEALATPATNKFDPSVLWWRHEPFQRSVAARFLDRHASFAAERDSIEAAWVREPIASAEAFALAEEAESGWRAALTPGDDLRPSFVRLRAHRDDREAGLVV